MRAERTWAAVLSAVLAAAGGATGCTAGEPAPELPAWSWEMPGCVGYDPSAYASPGYRRSVGENPTGVSEVYEPGWATRAIAEIRAVVQACGSYEHGRYGDADGFREQHDILASGFAGDDSMLVHTVRLAPPAPARDWFSVVVRRGDEVVTVRGATEEGALCAAAPATCPGGRA